jgi:hypothetical protein
MTNEERDIISQFIGRVGGAQAAQPSFGGSVPATTTPALPPVDTEADRFIGDLFTRYPDARYRITQLAFVQEHALAEAQNRIQRLEWELQQTRQAAQQAPQQQPAGGGGFFSGLFGGGSRQLGTRAAVDRSRNTSRPRLRRHRNTRLVISRGCSSGRVPAFLGPR